MSIIFYEIEEIRKLCENVVPNTKIIACTTAGADLASALVRVDIQENQEQRQLTVCLRFPEGYPKDTNILVELKSRTLADKFLEGLTKLAERHAREILGKPQGLHVLRFLQQYLHDNPLCVCYDEIQQLRADMGATNAQENLKLKQRSATVQLTANGGQYYYRIRAVVPDDYPQKCIDLQKPETNIPAVLVRYLEGQSREIARQCVEPPLRLSPEQQKNFKPAQSLYRTLKFCYEAARDFHSELCPICDKTVLPVDPKKVELDDTKDAFVERVYCGHLFHQGCLKRYLQEPPFPKSGKLCPAKKRHPRSDAQYYLGGGTMTANAKKQSLESCGSTCNIRLAHDRWVVNIKVAESRWAQKQARQRELQEVVDFLK